MEKIKFQQIVYAVDEHDLQKIAKRAKLQLPSQHLAVFKTVYAKIEEPNKNGVRLAKDAVEKFLPSLLHKQVNLNHWRYGYINGHIVDAWINTSSEIEVAFTFYKDIYAEDFGRALVKLHDGELAVSFEISNDPETTEYMNDGTRRLHNFEFAGMGLLIDEDPAYPGAKVYDMAKKIMERIESNQDEAVIFANQIKTTCTEILEGRKGYTTSDNLHWHEIDVDASGNGKTITVSTETGYDGDANHVHPIEHWKVLESSGHEHSIMDLQFTLDQMRAKSENSDKNNTTLNQGGEKQMDEEQKKLVAQRKEELGEFAKDYSDEDLLDDTKYAEAKKAMEEAQASQDQENSQNDELAEAKTKIEELETQIAELNEALKAKDSEIDEVRKNAELIGKRKVELADNSYAKDFSDEDYLDEAKIESVKLKKENDDLKKANKDLNEKAKKAETKDETVEANNADLDTGHEDTQTPSFTPEDVINKRVQELNAKKKK